MTSSTSPTARSASICACSGRRWPGPAGCPGTAGTASGKTEPLSRLARMCGICGLVSLDGATAPDPAALAAMNDTLVHRGPDSDGSMIDGPGGLAMRRLSIIDLAGGSQPIGNEDGRIQVIQNGEIYNYRE